MPLIDILPNSSTSTSAPGWAYVPDTGYDPSKAPIVPSGARKRARNAPFGSASAGSAAGEALSARQQSKIAKHLAELDKDSHRDVHIVVPGKSKDAGQKGAGRAGKMTPAVRKILTSQKTWANYLADEEAMLASLPAGAVLPQYQPLPPAAERRASVELKRRDSGKQIKKPGRGRPRASLAAQKPAHEDAMDVDAPAASQAPATADVPDGALPAFPATDSTDIDPSIFFRSRLPPLPTQEQIDALLAAPPLTYNAARAAPTTSTAPPRQFCEICGYWGRARCMKCGVRVCGLECKTQHDETRCLKFYA